MTDGITALFDDARTRLAGLPRERLGRSVPARRILGIARAPRIVPVGEAWHLGVLLLTDDAVLATGDIVRARFEVRRGYAAQSQRERAELAAAAFRGGFAEGEPVHVGWRAAGSGGRRRRGAVGAARPAGRRPECAVERRGGLPGARGISRRAHRVAGQPAARRVLTPAGRPGLRRTPSAAAVVKCHLRETCARLGLPRASMAWFRVSPGRDVRR